MRVFLAQLTEDLDGYHEEMINIGIFTTLERAQQACTEHLKQGKRGVYRVEEWDLNTRREFPQQWILYTNYVEKGWAKI